MKTGRITKIIPAALCFIVFAVIMSACDTNQGMMHGSGSAGMGQWSWTQILVSLVVGALLGFLLGRVTSRKK